MRQGFQLASPLIRIGQPPASTELTRTACRDRIGVSLDGGMRQSQSDTDGCFRESGSSCTLPLGGRSTTAAFMNAPWYRSEAACSVFYVRSLGNLWDCEHLNPSPGNAVWIGWAGGNVHPTRSRMPEGWLERGLARCSLVRFQGGAALHCWGGGAARTASSGLDDGGLQPKSTIFATVPPAGLRLPEHFMEAILHHTEKGSTERMSLDAMPCSTRCSGQFGILPAGYCKSDRHWVQLCAKSSQSPCKSTVLSSNRTEQTVVYRRYSS